jgi:hypothetical protein
MNVTALGDIDAISRTDSVSAGGLVQIGNFEPTAIAGGKTRAYAGNGIELHVSDLNLLADGDAKADAELLSVGVTGGVAVNGLKPTAITSNDVEAYVGRNDDATETTDVVVRVLGQDGVSRGTVDAVALGSTIADAETRGFAAAGIVGVSLATSVAAMEGKTRAYVGRYTDLTAGDVNLTATEVAAQALSEVASTSVSGAVDVAVLTSEAYAARITETFVGDHSTVNLGAHNLTGVATTKVLDNANQLVPMASASIASVGGAGLVDVNDMTVIAVVGQKDPASQESATRAYVGSNSDVTANNVTLDAVSSTTVEADASNFSAAGLVAVSVSTITARNAHDGAVYIGDDTDLTLDGTLHMLADNTVTARPQSKNTGFAGAVSVGSATIRTDLDADTDAWIGKNGIISADSIDMEARGLHTAEAAALNTGVAGLVDVALLDVQVVDNGGASVRIGAANGDATPGTTSITTTSGGIDLDAALTSNVTALTSATSVSGLGSGIDTDTSAINNAAVKGHIGSGVDVDAATVFHMQGKLLGKTDASATSVQLTGGVSVNVSDTESTFSPDVVMTTGQGGSIHAGQSVTVLGLLNYDEVNDEFLRFSDGYGAFGNAEGTGVALLAAVDHTVIDVDNNSLVDVTVAENMSLTSTSGDINVAARHSNEAYGAGSTGGFGGFARVADITADIKATGTTNVSFLGDVGDGTAAAASDINFDAAALSAATSTMSSGGGSIFGDFAEGQANATTNHTINATFGGSGSTMNVANNINGKAFLLADADASGSTNGFGGFVSSASVGTAAAATGVVNFTVGATDHVEAGNLIELVAEQGGEGSDISDGTVLNSSAANDTINFGNFHKLNDGATITYSGTTGGGLTSGKDYTVVVFDDTQIQLGTRFAQGNVTVNRDTITIANHAFEDGDQVIYNSNGGTPITGLSNGSKYQVKVVDENTIKLQTIGFTEVEDSFTRAIVDAVDDKILDTSTPFNNGDVVTYRPAEPRIFVSTFVDAIVTLDNENTEVNEFSSTQDGSNVGRIFLPGHGFSNGDAVIYTALDGYEIPGLNSGQTYYVVNGGAAIGGTPLGAAYQPDANFIRLAANPEDAIGRDLDPDPGVFDYDPVEIINLPYRSDNADTGFGFEGHSLIGVGESPVGDLNPGQSYYVVEKDANGYKLATDAAGTNIVNLYLSGNTEGGSHRFVREGIDLQSTGTGSNQTLVFDLTSNSLSGVFDGVGGAAGFALPDSADGIVNSSAGGSGGSLGWSNQRGKTYAAQVARTNFTMAANGHLKADDITIRTDGDANAVANADGGGGGSISIAGAEAYATVVNTSLIDIGQNAVIDAFNDITVKGILKSYAASEAETTSGSLLGAGADGTAESRIYYGVDQQINGDLTAGDAILIQNLVDNNATAKSEAYGGGIFGVSTSVDAVAEVRKASQLNANSGIWARHNVSLLEDPDAAGDAEARINAYYDQFRGAEITLNGAADLVAQTITITSDVTRNRANSNTNTVAGAAGGSAKSYSTSRIVAENRVVLNNGSELTGNESILVQAQNLNTNNFAKSKARLYAIGGSTRANSTNEVTNDVKIEGHWESILRTADLDVNAIDTGVDNDRSRSPGGGYIGPRRRGGDSSTDLTRDIFWEAHVILLGEPNPYLHIDRNGVIQSLSNIDFLGVNAGKTVGDTLDFISASNKQVVLDDIIFDQAGKATFYASADSRYNSLGRIWGNEGLIESQRSWDFVTLINESEWDLVINHIDAIDGGAVVDVIVDDIKFDGSGEGNNTSNTAGTVGNTFEFRLNLLYPQTAVRILNMDHALDSFDFYTGPVFDNTAFNTADSDIILLGGIENTFGHTQIINERGNIRADQPELRMSDPNAPSVVVTPVFEEALIRTNTVELDASGDIGNQSALTGRKAVAVELLRIEHAVGEDDPIELKEISLTADAGGDAVLDITLHDRTTDAGPVTVEIERIRAGDDVDVVINDSLVGNAPSTLTGLSVQTFNPPDLVTTQARTGSYFRYWSPDADGGASYYDFIGRSLNTTATEVDSTYVFVEVRAGDDIDIGHVTTNDVYTDGAGNPLPGEENRSYRTTDLSYSLPNPNPRKITDIDVTPATSSTTVNFVVFGDADWTGGSSDDGVEQIWLTTNGNILAQELSGDMLVGHIHSTAGDVTLWSGGRILDADGTATVDVTAANITLYSGVPTGAQSGSAVLTLLLGQSDGFTAGGLTVLNGVGSPGTGGIGEGDDFLEINVDRNNAGGATGHNLDAFDTNAGTNTGIFIDEMTGDLRVGQVETGGDVSLRTVAGSIVDRPEDGAEDVTDADIIARAVNLDANGLGASIGEIGNDLEIDSRNGSAGSETVDGVSLDAAQDDVALEALQNIFVTETEGALRLVLAHALYGTIRLTVRETSETEENLLLVDSGVANFAESDARYPGLQDDHNRVVAHGTIFAERGDVLLLVADGVVTDANSDLLAAGDITIFGDANYVDGADQASDPDAGYGTRMTLRGRMIAGAEVTPGQDGFNAGQQGGPVMGSAIATFTTPVYGTTIFGNDDVDQIQFGDTSGGSGQTTQGSDGFIYLGSRTTVYGSDTAPTDGAGVNGKGLSIGDDGEDRFRVYFLQDTATVTSPSMLDALQALGQADAGHTLTLDGQADTDTYEIYVLGSDGTDERNYVINALDTGAEDDGVDELHVLAPSASLTDPDGTDDIFLMRAMQYIGGEAADRPGFVALLHGTVSTYQDVVQFNEDSAEVSRIQYDSGINGRMIVEGREGDDQFYSDDVTVITTLDGGAGDDTFQVGQIFGMNRTLDANMLPTDIFPELVATTRGWLSPGSSAPLVAQGGTGNDTFRVYSNQSELRLEGDDDNDLFIVRAFALAATTDFDWNGDSYDADPSQGAIDVDDLEAGAAVMEALETLRTTNGWTVAQAIDNLTDADVAGFDIFINAAWRTDLKAKMAVNGATSFNINGDFGINFLDLLLTPTVTDDVIVLDADGVASPQIGLGFSVAQAPDIRAGGGQDEVRYNVNAPVSVDGGAGFDKMVILGTEFADDIVIRADGIFGAGLNVRYSTIEAIEVDGLEGDDEFFVLSTAFGVSYRVIGGLGSDVINVGGDVTEDIVTRELEGATGTVDHLVRSSDVLYDGVVIDGFDYNVARDDSGLVVINEEAAGDTSQGRTVVGEESLLADQYADFYTIRLAQAPTDVVYVTVSAARSFQEERDIDPITGQPYDLNPDFLTDALGETVWLSAVDPTGGATPGGATVTDLDFQRTVVINGVTAYISQNAITYAFTAANYANEVGVYVFAPDDDRSEGDRVTVIQHSVVSEDIAYNGIDVRNVEAEVLDNDTPGIKVREVDAAGNDDGRTVVVEGTDTTELTDEVRLSLARDPAFGETVVVDIVVDVDSDNALEFSNITGDSRLNLFASTSVRPSDGKVVIGTMTFTNNGAPGWDDEIRLGVEARDDFVREDLEIAVLEFERNDATTDADYIFPNLRSGFQMLDVEVHDNETSGAVVLETGGDTLLVPDNADTVTDETETDSYQIRLTRQPDDSVTVAVLTDGLADVTSIEGITITPEDYAVIGGLQATQLFSGNLVFGTDGSGNLTVTRGEGADLGSFQDEGFFGESLEASVRFDGTVTFGNDGTNLTIGGAGVGGSFSAGDTIRVRAGSAGGFDTNNDDYVVSSVSANQIVLTALLANGDWDTAGSADDVQLSDFATVPGERIRLDGLSGAFAANNGDYVVMSVSADGQTLTLTATTADVPGWAQGAADTEAVLSDLAENFIFEGTVSFGEETDPLAFPGQFLDIGLAGAQEGWLADGFLEGMWVRISDLNGGNPAVEAKIQLIRGDNDSQDAKLQLIHVTIDGTEMALADTWLGDAAADQVQVVRIAPEVTFTDGNWYDLQTVTLTADADYVVPPTRDGVKIFPVSTHLLSKLRGPLAVEGGPAGADRSLTAGVKLPGEADDFLIAIGAQPPESQQIDVLNIFNDSSQADTSGVLTQTTLRGFGMADDLVFENVSGPLYGEAPEGSTSITVPGGISFGKINYGSLSVGADSAQSTIEVLNIMLGQGNDTLEINGTLDPAPFVSAQNVFSFSAPGQDPDQEDAFDTFYTVRSEDIDWKAEGFLPNQTVTVDAVPGVFFTVVEVADAIYLDGEGQPVLQSGAFLRDPNDNSVLVLEAVGSLTAAQLDDLVAAFAGEVRLVAVDALVLDHYTYGVESTPTGAVLTGIDWESEGFLEGHLINIGGEDGSFDTAVQYRVLSIEGDRMEILGDTIEAAVAASSNIWVQGPHGGLTVVHGGGNLPVQTFGAYTTETISDSNYLLRDDGRDWANDGYTVGQLIYIEGETDTREILAILDADDVPSATTDFDKPDGASATWGNGSVLVLSGDPIAPVDENGDGSIDIHKSVALKVEVTTTVTLLADQLGRTDGGSWLDDGFAPGQVIFIEGIPGGFTIDSVTAETITLAGAAIHECVIEEGTEITVYRIDLSRDDGAQVGGDHFIIGLDLDALGVDASDGIDAAEQAILDNAVLAGSESPLVVYGDTSQDGVWYGGRSSDRLGLEFGPKPFNPFPDLPDEENEDDEWVFPLANPFDFAGNDVIDASALFAYRDAQSVGFTAYGGAGNDSIIGSQAGDHLAGGSGDDTILGQDGTDHIYGDSGVNVNILTRALHIVTSDNSPAPTIDPTQGASDQTFKPVRVASPMRDDMQAGVDVLYGDDSIAGTPENTPNIIFGDHGQVVMWVDDPNLPPVLLQRIQTTDMGLVLEINTVEFQNGGDDVIFGSAIEDLLIGGAGNDMIDGREGDDLIFGDHVSLTQRFLDAFGNRVDHPTDMLDMTSLRFQALAGVLMYSRTDRNSAALMGDGTTAARTPEFAYAATGTDSLNEYNSGRLLTNGIAQMYRDTDGPDWWSAFEIDYAQFHTFAINDGREGVGSFGNDYIAGGAGNDQIFGQLGHDVIQGDGSIDDAVAGIAHVGAARVPNVDGFGIDDPVGPLTVVASFEALTDGQDYIEGGGGRDVVFGGLGQDDIVGGSSDFYSLVTSENRPDSDDWLFGGAGLQIDRNNGFDPLADTDGNPETYGEDVTTALGVAYADKHGRDSDAIVGDNGDIIRIVGVNGVDINPTGDPANGPNYVEFNYDNYGGEKIVVRGVRLIDYTPGGPDFAPETEGQGRLMWSETCDPNDGFWSTDIGGHDEVHGETGDDFIYLGGGFDIAFGDADDDDIIGGWGHYWISGGTGDDGILGDDGRIFTSRNTSAERAGELGQNETLYGIDYLLNRDPDTRTSQGNVLNELIRTPGNVQVELINVAGELKKSVDLTPFALGETWVIDDPLGQNPRYADDVIFGGLGVDWLHGGDGDDAISGAEALEDSYAPRFGQLRDENGALMFDEFGELVIGIVGLYKSDFNSPFNPADILAFGDDTDPWNDPKPIRARLGEFFLYDEYDARRTILFELSEDHTGTTGYHGLVWGDDGSTVSDDTDPTLLHYFLNFHDNEGVSALGYVAFEPNGQTPDEDVPAEFRQSDGDDMIFGDLGNDWIVGGTGRDRMYGGFGNDLMNADDVMGGPAVYLRDAEGGLILGGGAPVKLSDVSVHDAHSGLNDGTDTHWLYEDRAFGGAGLDILIGNTKGDRLIDWVGEFNSYIVPFAPFGIATVSRQVPPHLFDFLYAQAFGDGVDITRTADGNAPNHNDRYSNVALLQGGLRGEIGLVTQKDHGYWQDQTGGPSDPQAGNIPGGRRDVLRTSDFNNNSGDIFIRDTGNMTVQGGALTLAATSTTSQASAVYNLDEYLPGYYEIRAQISTAKPTGGSKSNAYIIFDYKSDIDFKYAGINISNNKIEMGYRDASGYHELVQSNKPVRIKPDTMYDVLVAVNGTNVTVQVNGVNWFTYDYVPEIDIDGQPIPLNKGFVGFATDGGTATVDNFTVQVLPPDWTMEMTDSFEAAPALFMQPESGDWTLDTVTAEYAALVGDDSVPSA